MLIVIIILGSVILYRQPSGKQRLDKFMLRLPLFGDLVLWYNTARFSRTLSNLLKAGILLPEAMNIVLRNIANVYIRDAIDDVRTKLLHGQPFSAVLGMT